MEKRDIKKRKISLLYFLTTFALISVIQSILIMVGIVSQVTNYFSFGNIVFNLIRLFLLIYMAIYFLGDGLKKSFLNGALSGFTSSFILIVFSYVSKQCCKIPILGMSVFQAVYWQVLLFIILGNVLIWGIISLGFSWIIIKLHKK